VIDYKYPGITLADLMKEQQGLTLPQLGASAQFGQPREISLGADLGASDASAASTGMASIGAAIPQGLATAASGVMQAQATLEKQKRKAMSEGASEAGKGRYETQQKTSQAQINPLKALIANYRASIG
jgi:hypothetical protein